MSVSLDLTVITPTITDRARLLTEAAASIAGQSLPPAAWLVGWDTERVGPIPVVNRLAQQVDTEWLFRLDDDDLLYPGHFDTLYPHLSRDADVVYSWCRVEGLWDERRFQRVFSETTLRYENTIPSAACIRTSLWRKLGGYQRASYTPFEDYDFWLRALDSGAKFVCVPQVTWVYRMGDWQHLSDPEQE